MVFRHVAAMCLGVLLGAVYAPGSWAAPVDDALLVLERAMESPEPSFRARALALRIGAGGATEYGPRGLYDPNPWVQSASLDALVATEEGRQIIDDWLADAREPFAAAAATVGLRSAGWSLSAPAVEARVKALDEGTTWERAPRALAAVAAGDFEALDVLLAELRAGNIALEPRFVADLARVGEEERLADAMAEGARRIEPELAADWAATRLALGDARAVAELGAQLGSGTELDRQAVLESLAVHEGRQVDRVRVRAARLGPRWIKQIALCQRVRAGRIPVTRLRSLQRAEDPMLRAMAAECAVAAVPPTRASSWVRTGLEDDSAIVRISAARASRGLTDPSLVELLTGLLAEEGSMEALEAAGALLSKAQP